jgi:glycosyltransferase involved in cell wall biosynthesis
MRLTVGLDASVVASSAGGTRVYALQLLRALSELRPNWKFVLYLRNQDEVRQLEDLVTRDNLLTRVVGARPNVWRIHWALPIRLESDQIDIYHSLGFFLPLRWRGPKVVTVHDLNVYFNARNWLRGPTLLAWADLAVQTWLSMRAADRVITDSESSRRQIGSLMHLPEAKIRVIPLAADPFFNGSAGAADRGAARDLGGGRPFVLFVGVLSPQKNILTLLRAFAKSALPGDGTKLILAGSDIDDYGSKLRAVARSLGVDHLVVMPGFVSTHLLRALYQTALCVVLPSHGEGFGLPLVEGIASGTPILAANRQAIPEVLGDAGCLFEPDNLGELVVLLNRLGANPEFRESLARRSRSRAKQYSWRRTAEATAEVYEEVAAARRR